MDINVLISKAKYLIESGHCQEEVEKRLLPEVKNDSDKKLLTNKIFDLCFQEKVKAEMQSQLKVNIAAGLFVVVISFAFIFIIGRPSLVLFFGGLYYAYIHYRKLRLSAKEFYKRKSKFHKEERRF